MLLGKLDEEKVRRWAWNRDNSGEGACDVFLPGRDLKDIDAYQDLEAVSDAHE
jgi:hypothetical protein